MLRKVCTAVVLLIGIGYFLLVPSLTTPKSHIYQSLRRHRLQKLSAGILAYHDQHGTFPRSTYANQGLLSWRVEILPFIGEQLLYDEIDKTVAWNHPRNLPFHERMPDVFRDPTSRTTSQTPYRIVSGPGTAWTSEGPGIKAKDIKDGLSRTIGIIALLDHQTNWLDPKTIIPGTTEKKIQFDINSYTYANLDGSVLVHDPRSKFVDSPFLIDDTQSKNQIHD